MVPVEGDHVQVRFTDNIHYMKVLLINSNMLTPPITPLGLAYVAMACREAGRNVSLLDLNFSRDPKADIEKAIIKYSPDVIGISIRNIDNVAMLHSVYYIPKIKEIVHGAMQVEDELDQQVRQRIRNIQEGTAAWDIEYKRMMEEIRRS